MSCWHDVVSVVASSSEERVLCLWSSRTTYIDRKNGPREGRTAIDFADVSRHTATDNEESRGRPTATGKRDSQRRMATDDSGLANAQPRSSSKRPFRLHLHQNVAEPHKPAYSKTGEGVQNPLKVALWACHLESWDHRPRHLIMLGGSPTTTAPPRPYPAIQQKSNAKRAAHPHTCTKPSRPVTHWQN